MSRILDNLPFRRKFLLIAIVAMAALPALNSPQMTGQVQELRAKWTSLANDVGTGALAAPASLARHTQLVDEQMLLLEDLTFVSGLELDPDAASYHLIMASSQLDQSTQANAALVEESTAASGSLRQQALLLQQSVASFKLA